jgi:hypothetical protein
MKVPPALLGGGGCMARPNSTGQLQHLKGVNTPLKMLFSKQLVGEVMCNHGLVLLLTREMAGGGGGGQKCCTVCCL